MYVHTWLKTLPELFTYLYDIYGQVVIKAIHFIGLFDNIQIFINLIVMIIGRDYINWSNFILVLTLNKSALLDQFWTFQDPHRTEKNKINNKRIINTINNPMLS